MPKHGREHAYGPYPNRSGWRVIVVDANGTRVAKIFADPVEAAAVVASYRDAIDRRTVGDAITDHLNALTAGGARPSTVATTRMRLLGILRMEGLGFAIVKGDRPLRSVTPRLAAKLYAQRQADGVSAATHRGELGCAQRLWEHARKKGWIAVNPWQDIEPVGVPGRGKPGLRVDEARRLLSVLTDDSSPEATAVMMCLLMGLRAHEVVQRVGRDVDNDGRLLWIPNSKTAAGVRQLAIPSALRKRLRALVRGPEERLFKLDRYQLWAVTVKFAKQAGVPRVTPHGLRGTFATLALTGTSGASQVVVAALAPQFGHGDRGATLRRHYLAPGAEESANVARLESVLASDAEPEETIATEETSWAN